MPVSTPTRRTFLQTAVAAAASLLLPRGVRAERTSKSLLPGDLPGKLPGNQQGEGRITGLDDLRQKWSALEQRWAGYLASLTPEALEELVHKKSTSSGLGKRWGTRRADVLLHVCTHAHYTAAQVVNMLRQTGVETLPETMLISLARHKAT